MKNYKILEESPKEGDFYINEKKEISRRNYNKYGRGNDEIDKLIFCENLYKKFRKIIFEN